MQRMRNLFKSSKKQKEEAFNKIYHENHDFLYSVAMKFTLGNQEEAYDILQESFTKAYKAIVRFDGKNPRAWLKTILRNTYFDYYKKHKKEASSRSYGDFDEISRTQAALPEAEFTVENFEELLQALESNPDSDDWQSAASTALCDELIDALKSISPQYRTVLLSQHVTELSYDEIAETMDCKLGTVMSRLNRARQALKSSLMLQGNMIGAKLNALEIQKTNGEKASSNSSLQKEAG